jgi:methylase of polypeptide subunit release factors
MLLSSEPNSSTCMNSLLALRKNWASSVLGTETCLHQVSPYIGKLKSSIARDLIQQFTQPGDMILEPFSGSGVIALEALRLGRNVIASDVSDYAAVLTKAKLETPVTLGHAVKSALHYVRIAKARARESSYRIHAPTWVRSFFHWRTLAETKLLCDLLREEEQWFLLACVLGILHHQRPGFLSFPSSHLVPYLRRAKFPRKQFPELYVYRDVEPRLVAKIQRAFRRYERIPSHVRRNFRQCDVRRIRLRTKVDAIITSPPYMNALDYGRDNRLRLWFIGITDFEKFDASNLQTVRAFSNLMDEFSAVADRSLKRGGVAVLIVGEVRRNERTIQTQEIVRSSFQRAGVWRLIGRVVDSVPDVRRSRRECRATKREWIMVFKKRKIRS